MEMMNLISYPNIDADPHSLMVDFELEQHDQLRRFYDK
jgi:hypothetical protein